VEEFGVQTNNPWRFLDQHPLWLLDRSESVVIGYNRDEINNRKIEQLPIDVQVMIGAR
jgi:hypothetical protein